MQRDAYIEMHRDRRKQARGKRRSTFDKIFVQLVLLVVAYVWRAIKL